VAAEPSIGRATRVERPLAPSADAAGDLYERYSAQIFGYCHHQLGSREEAEDAVQTTFMNAFRGLSRGIVPELESAWLFKIAHNVCLSRRRSSWRRGKVEAPNNLEVLQEVIPGREQVADELIGLQDVLETMPENQRRAILLREWQGLTYREISAELGLSQSAVETLIFRARRALAQGLEQDADTWKRRLRRGADVGGAIAFVKALLGGGGAAAVKIAVTAAVVATTAVAAATEVPKHDQHAPAAKPTPAAGTPLTSSTTKVASTSPASTARLGHRSTARPSRPAAGERTLPKPVAVPASHPEETTGASMPAAPPAAAAPSSPQTLPQSQPAPAPPTDNGHGNGGKIERTPQATTQTTEPTPVPPAADAQSDQGQGNDDKSDKPGNGNGNGNGDDKSDKPGHGNGDDNGKGNGKPDK
jgi:RNA polymerase sigma factor (sigma-70 family)